MKNRDLNTINQFEEHERIFMKEFYIAFLKPMFENDYIPELYLTKGLSGCAFDAVIYLKNKITYDIEYKFLIEIKCRPTDFDTIMFEKKKYNGLLKEHKKAVQNRGANEDNGILYIIFTEKKTFVFNILSDKIQSFLKVKKNLVKESHVKTTFIQDDKKIIKPIWYLPKEFAQQFNYTTEYNF